MLLYSNSLGLRASAREWSGDLGGAEADAVAALALLPADDPIVLPSVLSALTDVYIERGSPEAATALLRDSWPTGRAATDAQRQPGAGVPRPARAAAWAMPRAALADLEEAGRRALAIAYVNPMALMWRSYAALAAARLGERDQAHELIAGGARDRAPLRRSRSRSARPSACGRCSRRARRWPSWPERRRTSLPAPSCAWPTPAR